MNGILDNMNPKIRLFLIAAAILLPPLYFFPKTTVAIIVIFIIMWNSDGGNDGGKNHRWIKPYTRKDGTTTEGHWKMK